MSVRIAWACNNLDIELEENIILVLTIENTEEYVKFLSEVNLQSEGEVGTITLSSDGKELNFNKTAEIIFNPFALDMNNKKIITKLYQNIKEVSENSYQEQTIDINSKIVDYMDNLIVDCPYNLEYDIQLDIVSLLKMLNVKISVKTESLLERIIEYIRVCSRICGINIFFGINLKDYLSPNDIDMLYEFIKYEKVNLILVESRKSDNYNCEKHWILDKDRCIIESDELTM